LHFDQITSHFTEICEKPTTRHSRGPESARNRPESGLIHTFRSDGSGFTLFVFIEILDNGKGKIHRKYFSMAKFTVWFVKAITHFWF
jgi:hypothetical protein